MSSSNFRFEEREKQDLLDEIKNITNSMNYSDLRTLKFFLNNFDSLKSFFKAFRVFSSESGFL